MTGVWVGLAIGALGIAFVGGYGLGRRKDAARVAELEGMVGELRADLRASDGVIAGLARVSPDDDELDRVLDALAGDSPAA